MLQRLQNFLRERESWHLFPLPLKHIWLFINNNIWLFVDNNMYAINKVLPTQASNVTKCLERESCRNEFLIERSLSAQPVLLICCTVLIPLLCCWYVVRCMTPLSLICCTLYHSCVVDTLFIVWLLLYGYGACSRHGSCTLHCNAYSAYQKITSAACVVDMWYSIWLLCPCTKALNLRTCTCKQVYKVHTMLIRKLQITHICYFNQPFILCDQ